MTRRGWIEVNQRLDPREVWNAAKTAIDAYEEDPTATNSELVEVAVRSIREMNERFARIGRTNHEQNYGH